MKQSIAENLLRVIATVADHNRICFNLKIGLSVPGDPDRRKYRDWLEKALTDDKKRKKIQDSLSALKRRKFLQEKIINNSKGYVLTPKGRLKVFKLELKDYKKKKLQSGNYLMVFFDIPEKIRRTRNAFRFYLKELGFEQLQKSIWVSQFDVIKELNKIIKDYQIGQYVKALMVKEMDLNTKK